MANDGDRYLSENDFCIQFGIAPRTAQRWRRTGAGPKWVRIGLRRICYNSADCGAWVAANTFKHRADELQRAGSSRNTSNHAPHLASSEVA